MAFVRAKTDGGRTYYQLVESVRDGDKVRQQILAYMGTSPDLDAAISRTEKELAIYRNLVTYARQKLRTRLSRDDKARRKRAMPKITAKRDKLKRSLAALRKHKAGKS